MLNKLTMKRAHEKVRQGADGEITVRIAELSTRTTKGLLVTALIGGLLLRLLFWRHSSRDIFSTILVIDAEFYDAWAKAILGGDWLGTSVYYQDPLYAYFLAGCYKLFGTNIDAIRIIQCFLDIGTIALLYSIGARIFSRTAGVIAALLAAVYGPFVYYTVLLDKTTLTLFLSASSLLIFLRASSSIRPLALICAGISLGLAALIRGQFMLVTFVFAGWLLIVKRNAFTLGQRAVYAMYLLLGTSLIIGPIFVRNYYVGKDRVLLTANAGLNFFIGNNPHTAGNYNEPPFIHGIPSDEYADSKYAAERFSGRKFDKPSEVSGFWFRQGLAFIFARPGEWLTLVGRKLLLVVNRFEIPETYSFYYFADRYTALSLAWMRYPILLALSIGGFCLVRGYRGAAPVVLFAGTYAASLLVFFVTSRYRAPLVIGLFPVAGHFLAQLIHVGWRRLVIPICLCIVAFFTSHLTPRWLSERVIRPGLSTPYSLSGVMLLGQRRIPEAISALERARSIFPEDSSVWGYLGQAFTLKNEPGKAIQAYHEALKRNPFFYEGYNNLASLYFEQGRLADALRALESALKIRPDDPDLRRNYLNVLKAASQERSR